MEQKDKAQIFISYNLEDNSFELNWIENFKYFANILTERLLGNKIEIVTSSDLQDKDERKSLEDMVIYIVILTHSFGKFSAFQDELALMSEVYKKRLNEGVPPVIFKVAKSDVDVELQPDFIKKLLPYSFIPEKNINKDDYDFETVLVEGAEQNFWVQMVDLAFDIQYVLRQVKLSGFAWEQEKVVYLAEVTADQVANRDLIKRELHRHGIKTLPDTVLSDNPVEQRKQIMEGLGRCCLSVHIIGENYGDLLPNSEYSIVDFQNRVASDYYNKTKALDFDGNGHFFSKVIWSCPDLKIFEEKQRVYIETLKRDTEFLHGTDFLEAPVEWLKSFIRHKVQENIVKKSFRTLYKEGAGKNKIYFLYEKECEEEVESIIHWMENSGLHLVKPHLGKVSRDLMDSHRNNLIHSKAVLIYFNPEKTDLSWLKSKLSDVIKASGYGKKEPFLSKAVFIQGNYELEELYKNQRFIEIKGEGSFYEKFKPFIQSLRK